MPTFALAFLIGVIAGALIVTLAVIERNAGTAAQTITTKSSQLIAAA